jgi:hypothetical protein
MKIENNYLECTRLLFQYYRDMGDKALAQLDENALHWQPSPESNSAAMIIQHLSGNMLSRFTDFLTSDGEKEWRNREAEFEPGTQSKAAALEAWNKGWDCFFEAMNNLTSEDLDKVVYIRNQGHTVLEALQRQLGHYPYHIGQLVYLCRMSAGDAWLSLSIPKGGSQAFNTEKFAQEKSQTFFAKK